MRKMKTSLLVLLSVIGIVFAGTGLKDFNPLKNISNVKTYAETESKSSIDIKSIPEYSGTPYVVINGGKPSFSEKDKERVEEYSELDKYGRCGTAFANVSKELMPTKPRESIREVRPSGWHTVKYEKIIEDRYLYNRCHLIAYKLAGENANEKNLITGTRYFNVEGMLPFEDEVADYVNATGNHVLYRVRPIFKGSDLVARGVQMEAESVEDNGKGVSFNVYCYNVQPGIRINYKDGSSQPESEVVANKNKQSKKENDRKSKKSKKVVVDNGVKVSVHYIANTNTKKFHLSTCRSVKLMKAKNMYKSDNRKELIDSGYVPCKICRP
ncbi:hypothetical protein GCWU000282_02896 [Catonella morbi ATCC 51271]|uniref:Type VII secretion system protein EssD-like domain-containing protein n=1 Tax=Catonella morbi ATCC 51271 TaxID=592026 RepID=V2Y1Z1_9FIRM|nr:DNA/RNA non-specific endonuclease [Catonella morbi]ESL02077.1 hypothetical protein GCWU000282_02896 [Catonella morbi ATCC 51271]